MDPFDNPSTRDRVFANAGDSAEPSDSSECPREAVAPNPDASAEVPSTTAAPAPEDSVRSQDDLQNDPIDEARREKIANLKKAVADGTYNVSAEELADKLIEHMLEP
jgi:anti-sigma28 factor (negative regulator of flagellin synthesis)